MQTKGNASMQWMEKEGFLELIHMNGIKQLTWMEGLGFHYALCFKCACLITSEIEWNNKLSSHYGSETQVEFCQKSLDSWASSHGYMHLVRQEEALCQCDVKCSAVHGWEPPRNECLITFHWRGYFWASLWSRHNRHCHLPSRLKGGPLAKRQALGCANWD